MAGRWQATIGDRAPTGASQNQLYFFSRPGFNLGARPKKQASGKAKTLESDKTGGYSSQRATQRAIKKE
jgi:hypothetical protein